jgi:hypothetical protein
MEIIIDLTKDYTLQIIKQIEHLESNGFIFADKSKWISKKIDYYENQIIEYSKQGIDDSTIKKLLEKENLEHQWNDHQVISFFSFKTRLVESKPRKIKYSSKFVMPTDNELIAGVKLLERNISMGINLFPHLSRRIFDTTFTDGMLFDWGIHHFHIGIKEDKKNPQLIQGKNEIIYGFVTDTVIYFLIIGVHGQWADKDILLIVRNEFPDLITPFKLNGIIGLEKNITEKEHNALRSAGVNTITELNGEFYAPLGGGITTAGTNIPATRQWHFICRLLDKIEDYLQKNLISKLLNVYPSDSLPEVVELHLTYNDETKLTVEDNNKKIKIEANLNETKNDIKDFTWNISM